MYLPRRSLVVGVVMSVATLSRAQSAPTVETTTTAPTATTTTYPTTVTSIWSTIITSTASPPDSWITARTVTVLEPWPVSPDPYNFPYTINQTSIVRETVTHATSTTTLAASTAFPTWVVWDTQAADLPVGNVPQCEPVAGSGTGSKGCAPPAWKPDTRCLELGLETRCHAQCIIRNWQWWCQKATIPSSTSQELPMGRLCWGDSHNYTQLVEPCDDTDYPPDCDVCPAIAPQQ